MHCSNSSDGFKLINLVYWGFRWVRHPTGVLFLHKSSVSAESLLTSLQCFNGDPSCSESRSLFRCAQRASRCCGAAGWFIYLFRGTDPFRALAWGRGGGGRCWRPAWPTACRSPPAPFPGRPRSPGILCLWRRVPSAQRQPGWASTHGGLAPVRP